MDLIHPLVQEYAEKYSSAEDALLKEVNEYTMKYHSEAVMLSGHLQGKVLEMISCMIQPRRILEIGTFTGYSGLCLAKGLTDDGQLHTIELRSADAGRAQSYFTRSSYADKIILHTGNALDIIPQLQETWDLVFIDADKPAYIEYFNLVLPRLRKNGFILADNIFFHGQVLEAEVKGKSAKGIRAFNDFIKDRTDVEKVVLTIRDGLYLLRKL
ncbi:MAG: O-methyltransferase [Chitinophagaceae bacterium]|nr:O-methyltransferase [Chitinophagaceae bacterium]HQW42599.1 O-methyltransferase [Chitinophagaceae bacterium]